MTTTTTTQEPTMASEFYTLTDSIPAADLTPGMTLHRVAQRPLSAVFGDPVDAKVLAVEPFTDDRGTEYVKVTLEPKGAVRSSVLNLVPNRPVQASLIP